MAPVASTTSFARDPPHPLSRAIRRRGREVVGAALHRDDHVVVVVPERAGAGQYPDVRAGRQRLAGTDRELVRRAALDRRRAREETPPEDGPVLDEDDPRIGGGRRLRRHQAGRAGADDEHVAERVAAGRNGRGRARPAPDPAPPPCG